MRIVIITKLGFEIPITCRNASFIRNESGNIHRYKIDGAVDKFPLYLPPEDISVVYRDFEWERQNNDN